MKGWEAILLCMIIASALTALTIYLEHQSFISFCDSIGGNYSEKSNGILIKQSCFTSRQTRIINHHTISQDGKCTTNGKEVNCSEMVDDIIYRHNKQATAK